MAFQKKIFFQTDQKNIIYEQGPTNGFFYIFYNSKVSFSQGIQPTHTTDMALVHRCLSNTGTRHLRDVDVLVVPYFENSCSCPEISETHPRRLLIKHEDLDESQNVHGGGTRVSKVSGPDVLRSPVIWSPRTSISVLVALILLIFLKV